MRYSKQRTMAGFIGATGGLPLAPENTVAPSITGTATEGETLTVVDGTWTGREAPVLTYQWERDAAAIEGATGSNYDLVADDVGAVITVTVTGTNWTGSASETSAATAAVAAA